jgi:signal peptidase I
MSQTSPDRAVSPGAVGTVQWWRRFAGLAALTVGLVVLTRAGVVAPYEVHSDSMEPTVTEGQTVFVDKVTYRLTDLDPGQLVVFDSPEGVNLKRVVALAGDRVEILDATLHVNGAPVAEPYVDPRSLDGIFYGPETVPAGHVFVLGDNRFESLDSRHYGPVPLEDITGRVLGP